MERKDSNNIREIPARLGNSSTQYSNLSSSSRVNGGDNSDTFPFLPPPAVQSHLSSSSSSSSGSRSGSYSHTHSGKKLGLFSLAVLAFYSVNGGAFGIEDIVRAGGPFYALCGFSLLLVWAVPEALITMELSTAFPEASGSVAWVEAAFGPFWAFQKGWLSWLSGVSG